MRKFAAWVVLLLLLAVVFTPEADASKDGRYNASSGCSCHGSSNTVNPSLTGLPAAYVADTTYTLTVGMGGNPANGGFNIKVTKGTLSNPDANAQIASNGLQATHKLSATTASWTFDWTAPSTGSGTVNVNLAVVAGNGNGQKNSADVYDTFATSINEQVSTNDPPSISNLALSPSLPTTVDDLSVTYTYDDNDGDAESGTTFAWHLNSVHQPTHTTALLPSSATAKGQVWHVVVTPSDGVDAGTPVASSTVTILNSAPQVDDLQVSNEAPALTEDVTFSYNTTDPDGDAIDATESRWRLDGSPFSGLENTTTLPAHATRPGDVWDVQVRVSDGDDMSAWATSAAIIIDSTNTAPEIIDLGMTPSEGPTTVHDLLASWTVSDADGDSIEVHELQWLNNGVHVEAADDLNPLPASMTAKGDVWTVKVRANDGEVWSAWEESAPVTVENAAPTVHDVLLSSPSLSALDDLTLVVNTSDSDGDTVSIPLVLWHLNGEATEHNVNQTTLEAAFLTKGDVWHAVMLVSDGEDEVLVASETVTVGNAAPSVDVAWPASASSLSDLTPVLTVADVDGDATSVTLNWYKNGFRDASLTNATAVPAAKLAPGQVWALHAQASDGELNSEEVQASFTVPNLPPVAVIDVVSSNIWSGETTVLSATGSTDADGGISTYAWSWNGQTAFGSTVSLVLEQSTTVTLTVTDTNGAASTTSVELETTTGPSVGGLSAQADDSALVELSWTWSGDAVSFNILRNGNVVGSTNSTSFSDLPVISGANDYTVQPFTEERVYLHGAASVSVSVEAGPVDVPSPSEGLGYLLGGLLVTVLGLLPVMVGRLGGDDE